MIRDLFNRNQKYVTVQSTRNTTSNSNNGNGNNNGRNQTGHGEIPDGLIQKCKQCQSVIYGKELERNLKVCPKCGFHYPMSAYERLQALLDEGTFIEYDAELISADPLQFPDYIEKVNQDREKSGLNEAIVTGEGEVKGSRIVVGVMDSRFRMGSMGSVVGEKIARAIEKAVEKNLPFVLFSASGGARMQEGVLSLMQMAKTSAALNKLNKSGGLFVSYLTNPTTGGVSASFAFLGDIIVAEPGALIGFAGRRIIEQTIRQKLPEDFQTAEFLFKHGQLDKIIHRNDMKDMIAKILEMHNGGNQ